MSSPREDPDVSETDWFDPFPEPRTIPSGWDLSELVPDPQTEPVFDAPAEAVAESRRT